MNLEDLKSARPTIFAWISSKWWPKREAGIREVAFVCRDFVCALYFGGVLDHAANDPRKEDRDRFLSKGHAAPVLYATLAESGYFPKEELKTLRKLHSRLQGHPDCRKSFPASRRRRDALGPGPLHCRRHGVRPEARRQQATVFTLMGDGRMPGGPGLGGRYVRIPPQPGQPGRDSRP